MYVDVDEKVVNRNTRRKRSQDITWGLPIDPTPAGLGENFLSFLSPSYSRVWQSWHLAWRSKLNKDAIWMQTKWMKSRKKRGTFLTSYHIAPIFRYIISSRGHPTTYNLFLDPNWTQGEKKKKKKKRTTQDPQPPSFLLIFCLLVQERCGEMSERCFGWLQGLGTCHLLEILISKVFLKKRTQKKVWSEKKSLFFCRSWPFFSPL